jgi:hypothetical protein
MPAGGAVSSKSSALSRQMTIPVFRLQGVRYLEAVALNHHPRSFGALCLLVALTASTAAHEPSPSDHQVPAGTMLFIELRTPLASDSSQPQDQVRGVLKSAITIDGLELVPAGSVVLGMVTDAEAAVRKTDRAKLALRFNVLEHPQTGSRVPIRTDIRPFAVDAGKKKKGAEGPAAFNQVRLDAGADVSVSLREPFLVRIPDGN